MLPCRQPLPHLRPDAHPRISALVELGACCHWRGEALHTVPASPCRPDEGLQETMELPVPLD
eukprot:4219931-Pleurochrysis_carterae.AAC.1